MVQPGTDLLCIPQSGFTIVQPEDSEMEIWAAMGRVEVKPKAVLIVLKISAEIAPDIYMLSAIVGIGMSLTSLTQVNGKTSCD